MKIAGPKGAILILIAGIINIILGVAHQVVLYFTYTEYTRVKPPRYKPLLDDFLLFSIGIGITLLFIGFIAGYCYKPFKRGERWAYVICTGLSLLLLSFAVATISVMGFSQPIAYVHLLNSLLISVPLIISGKSFTKNRVITSGYKPGDLHN